MKQRVRNFVYLIYRAYKKYFEQHIPSYDLQTIDIIHRLPIDAVCIDVGVNEGQILHHLYKQCKKGKIIAIEPIPKLATYLRSAYNNKRVFVQEMAVSDTDKRSLFYYFPNRHAISGLRSRDQYHHNTVAYTEIEVSVRRLDDIFHEPRLDFIKIDVEGAEYNVLKGAEQLLKTFKPRIVFESGIGGLEYFGHGPDELFCYLTSLHYSISTLKHYLEAKPPFTEEEFICNFIKGYDFQYIAY